MANATKDVDNDTLKKQRPEHLINAARELQRAIDNYKFYLELIEKKTAAISAAMELKRNADMWKQLGYGELPIALPETLDDYLSEDYIKGPLLLPTQDRMTKK